MAKKDELDRLEEEIARLERELGHRTETEEPEPAEPSSRLRDLADRLPGRGGGEPPEPPEDETPEPEVAPVRGAAGTAWVHQGNRWRRPGPGGEAPVIVRRLDAEGNVVQEAPTEDPELVALARGSPASAPASRRGPPGSPAGTTASDGERPRWVVALGVLLLLVVVGAIAWYAVGHGGPGNPTLHVATTPSDGRVAVGKALTFDASSTTNPGGATLAYAWSFGDGSSAKGVKVTHTYQQSGTYDVTLTVRSGDNIVGTKHVKVVALAVPQPSLAVTVGGAAPSVSNPIDAGTPVNLSAAGTTSEANVSTYGWAFDDGGSSVGETASHAFTAAGPHVITLTVTTDQGVKATINRTIQVSSDANRTGHVAQAFQTPTNTTLNFTANPGGIAPARVELVLTYNSTAPLPGPLGGSVDLQPLNLTLRDASGAVLKSVQGSGGKATIDLTNLGSAALGTWQAVVQNNAGGQARDFHLRIHVVLDPLP